MTIPISLKSIVGSSNIAAYGYDDAHANLYVEFLNGGRYRYSDVPPDVAHRLDQSESKGSFLSHVIKPKFKAHRL